MSGQERSAGRATKRVPFWLFRFHKQASEEHETVRYESSSSEESMGTVAVQCRIAAELDRKQKEMAAKIAKLGEEKASRSENLECPKAIAR